MIKLSRLIFLILLAGSLAVACNKLSPSPVNNSPAYTLPLRINNAQLLVKLADTDDKRQQGLSGREPLTDSQGMLFDFRHTGLAQPGFWMKDMKFDLDLIWLKDNRVVGVTPSVPAPQTAGEPLPSYYPPSDIDLVLEVKAGWSDQHHIKVGDKLDFEFPGQL